MLEYSPWDQILLFWGVRAGDFLPPFAFASTGRLGQFAGTKEDTVCAPTQTSTWGACKLVLFRGTQWQLVRAKRTCAPWCWAILSTPLWLRPPPGVQEMSFTCANATSMQKGLKNGSEYGDWAGHKEFKYCSYKWKGCREWGGSEKQGEMEVEMRLRLLRSKPQYKMTKCTG